MFEGIPEAIPIAIGIGMFISLFLTETLGITAGGLIVPGYIGLSMFTPSDIFLTFIVSIITIVIIKFLSKFILIYGKRRLVLCLIIGFLIGFPFIQKSEIDLGEDLSEIFKDIYIVGYIIPGLIASWMDRQGIIRTISTIMITSSIVFLILFLIFFDQVV